jgi:tryptophan halogenase
MLNLSASKRIAIIGGGAAGWFAAITLRRIFSPAVEITLFEQPRVGISTEEGSRLNIIEALQRNKIEINQFAHETGASYKLGFVYEGWRGGGLKDSFYHLFGGPGVAELEWNQSGFFPLLSARIAAGMSLHGCMPAFDAITRNASQEEMRELLSTGASGFRTAFHFDKQRLVTYLGTIAQSRGVIYRKTSVDALVLNEQGYTYALAVEGERLNVDFVIDASGFERIGIGKTYNAPWCSFSKYLLPDRAISFHTQKRFKNPELVTRAVSMKAGWMWQTPLLERVGAGYVFSSNHIDEDTAMAEVVAYFKQHTESSSDLESSIKPISTLRFEPGHFKTAWVNNVVAIGTASGFVEPLEATSIGLMLEEIRNIERILVSCNGFIGQPVIDEFNDAYGRSWTSIRDFLCMHYDCLRNDTPFWQDVETVQPPDSYSELRACFQKRTPRLCDIEPYIATNWQGIFHMINWMFVAAPLGIIPAAAALSELRGLPADARTKVDMYFKSLKNRQDL